MLDMEAIRKAIVVGLREYLGIPVIRSNQTGEPPSYPYCSYTITRLASENKGTWGRYDDGMMRKPITQSWSVTVQSDNVSEAMTLALKAQEWFDIVGTTYLSDRLVIVQSVGGVMNRDNLLTIEYEYRNGFDVVLWLLNEVSDPVENDGYIEAVDLGNAIVEPPKTEEELNKMLEKRLEGD